MPGIRDGGNGARDGRQFNGRSLEPYTEPGFTFAAAAQGIRLHGLCTIRQPLLACLRPIQSVNWTAALFKVALHVEITTTLSALQQVRSLIISLGCHPIPTAFSSFPPIAHSIFGFSVTQARRDRTVRYHLLLKVATKLIVSWNNGRHWTIYCRPSVIDSGGLTHSL